MIQATLKRSQKQVNISISGHAGFAPYGKDIVCSAVSVLMQHTASHLSKANVIDDGKHYELTADIQNDIDEAFVSALQDTLSLIAGSYPKNFSLIIEG